MNFGKPINITVHFGAVQSSGGGAAITIDSALSSTSTNPVQNKVITGAIDELKTKVVEQTASEVTIQPNVMNVWEEEVTSLNITRGTDISGFVNNYMVRFKAGEGCDVKFFGFTLQWYGGDDPEWTKGNTYEISIVDDIALWAEFEPKQA
jgi:hypothetical protein